LEDKGVYSTLAHCKKLKELLLAVELESKYFKDGPPNVRDIYREELDASDIGYLTSLLSMLCKEDTFLRWKVFTTSTFGNFKGRKNGRENTG